MADVGSLSIPTIWSTFPDLMEELKYEMASNDRELTTVVGLAPQPTSVTASTLLSRIFQQAVARSTTIRKRIRQLKGDGCVSAADQDFKSRRLHAMYEKHLDQIHRLFQTCKHSRDIKRS